MEGCPKIGMINFDLKICNYESTDLPEKLSHYILAHYQENPENFSNEIEEILKLRENSSMGSKDNMGLNFMKKYYRQLKFLTNRFPMKSGEECETEFSWDHLYNDKEIVHSDVRYEQECLLYNIGAMYSFLGCLYKRINDEDIKTCCNNFQKAAWAFKTIRDLYSSLDYTSDLNEDIMIFKMNIMLAQAQECVLEKSLIDNRKTSINSKICAQIIDYYNLALTCSEKEEEFQSIIGSKQTKEIKQYCLFKKSYYSSLSNYFSALSSAEQNCLGESIAYIQLAEQKINDCVKMKYLKEFQDVLKYVVDLIENKSKSLKKENDFVYNEKIPTVESLPEIKSHNIVNTIQIDFDNDPEIASQDLFSRLVSLKAHELSSLYSEEKAKIIRQVNSDIEEKNSQLEQFLSALQINELHLSDFDYLKLPKQLLECCASVSVRSASIKQDLTQIMKKIVDVSIQTKSILEDIEELFEQEDKEYKKIKTMNLNNNDSDSSLDSSDSEVEDYKSNLAKDPRKQKLKELLNKYDSLVKSHNDANLSNTALRDAFNSVLFNLQILSLPLNELTEKLPKIEQINDEETKLIREKLLTLIAKVDEMKIQRAQLQTRLQKAIQDDDLTKTIASRQNDITNLDEFFHEQLKKHEQLLTYLNQNLQAQDNILRALADANALFASERKKILDATKDRNSYIENLITSYQTINELIEKANKGVSFFEKLNQPLNQLLNDVDEFCCKQKKERENRNKLFQNLNKPQMIAGNDLLPQRFQPLNSLKPNKPVEKYLPIEPDVNSIITSTMNDFGSNERPKLKDFLAIMKPQSWGPNAKSKQGRPILNKFDPNQIALSQHQTQMEQQTVPAQFSNASHILPNAQALIKNQNLLPNIQTHVPFTNQNNMIPINNNQYTSEEQILFNQQQLQQRLLEEERIKKQNEIDSENKFKLQHQRLLEQKLLEQQMKEKEIELKQKQLEEQEKELKIMQQKLRLQAQQQQEQMFQQQKLQYEQMLKQQQEQLLLQQKLQQEQILKQQQEQLLLQQKIKQEQILKQQQELYKAQSQSILSQAIQLNPQQQTLNQLPPQIPLAINSQQSFQNKIETMQEKNDLNKMFENIKPDSVYKPGYLNQLQKLDEVKLTPNLAPSTKIVSFLQEPNRQVHTPIQNFISPVLNQNLQHNFIPNNSVISNNFIPQNTLTIKANPVIAQNNVNNNFPSQQQAAHQNISVNSISPQQNLQSIKTVVKPSAIDDLLDLFDNTSLNQSSGSKISLPVLEPLKMEKPLISQQKKEEIISHNNISQTNSQTDLYQKQDDLNSVSSLISSTESIKSHSSTSIKPTSSNTTISTQRLNSLSNQTKMERFVNDVNKFEHHVQSLTNKTLSTTTILDKDWKELNDYQDKLSSQMTISVARLNSSKNRFQDLLPYDQSRVCLKFKKSTDDYINASYIGKLCSDLSCDVDSLKQQPNFICSQLPFVNEYNDFWSMILQEQIEIIICLCRDNEFGTNQNGSISYYWPNNRQEPLILSNLKICLQSSKESLNSIQRVFTLTNLNDNSTKTVVILQYISSKNKQLVPGSSLTGIGQNEMPENIACFLKFIKEFENFYLKEQRVKSNPILVHCMNGVSRSAVFILVYSMIQIIDSVFDLSINTNLQINSDLVLKLIKQMRSRRKYMIQSTYHLKYSYDAILYYLKDILIKEGVLSNNEPNMDRKLSIELESTIIKEESVSSIQSKNKDKILSDQKDILNNSPNQNNSISILELSDPKNFTLDLNGDKMKRKTTKKDFISANNSTHHIDPNDPFNWLDPLKK